MMSMMDLMLRFPIGTVVYHESMGETRTVIGYSTRLGLPVLLMSTLHTDRRIRITYGQLDDLKVIS